MKKIKVGSIYQHFKGKEYKIIGIGKQSETLEDMVVYKPMYKSEVSLWVRPAKMFFEKVKVGTREVSRFKLKNEKN